MTHAARVTLPWFLTALLAACATSVTVPPAMTPAAGSPVPDSSQGTIVLARPRSGCDTGDYSVVTDDHGRFIANVAPGTQVAATMVPGSYTLYAWSSRDVRFDSEPNYNPVAATRVRATAGQSEVIVLRVVMRQTASHRCYPYAPVTFRHVRPGESDDEAATTQQLVADQAAGQAEIEKDPARLKEHLEFGAERLRRNDEGRENAVRGDQGARPGGR
jgi:hypothetical protein